MIIREAVDEDIPQIVVVLKASLGEKDLPLSEEIWIYKHFKNPFGKSIILVAEEKGAIIGVRAFMKWQWRCGPITHSCFRAVDTATHPEHQGKGIFKKLTLKAIEICENTGSDFIFNTPNDQSRPGYLKMGWKSAGKIEVSLKPAFNSFWKFRAKPPENKISINTSPEELKILCNSWNENLKEYSQLITPKSPEYLKWRYEENPLIDYEVFASPGLYVAGYLKNRKNLKELRISECIYVDSAKNNLINKLINDWSSKYGVQIISFSPKTMRTIFPALKGSFGPILTVREINLTDKQETVFGNIKNWKYSLGDLELF